jgi:hypothetical protein
MWFAWRKANPRPQICPSDSVDAICARGFLQKNLGMRSAPADVIKNFWRRDPRPHILSFDFRWLNTRRVFNISFSGEEIRVQQLTLQILAKKYAPRI